MNVVTLTLNSAFDVHCYADSFAPHRENHAQITSREAGGKGINISRALASYGIRSTAVAVIGKENGDDFKRALADSGIGFVYIEAKGRIRENITLHTKDAPETRISFCEFRADNALVGCVGKVIDRFVDSDTILTFTGSLPTGVDANRVAEMLADMKLKGAKIVIDSRSFEPRHIEKVHPWLIKPNEEEIALYSSIPASTPECAGKAAKELREKCAENVMISLGSRGAVLASESGEYFAAAPNIDALSTIGAGDSMIAGFISAALEGLDTSDALRRAVAFGSAACLTEGTRPPRKEDIARFEKDIIAKKTY